MFSTEQLIDLFFLFRSNWLICCGREVTWNHLLNNNNPLLSRTRRYFEWTGKRRKKRGSSFPVSPRVLTTVSSPLSYEWGVDELINVQRIGRGYYPGAVMRWLVMSEHGSFPNPFYWAAALMVAWWLDGMWSRKSSFVNLRGRLWKFLWILEVGFCE